MGDLKTKNRVQLDSIVGDAGLAVREIEEPNPCQRYLLKTSTTAVRLQRQLREPRTADRL